MRVLLATMVSPSDKLPLDVVLPHQRRMLSSSPGAQIRALVLENRPPWLGGARLPRRQEEGLRRLEASGEAKVVQVNYSLFHDARWPRRFVVVREPGGQPLPVPVASLHWKRRGRLESVISADTKEYIASNFMGQLTFLEQCRAAGAGVDLCVYLDPDVFLHHSGQGLADLAPAVFARDPSLVSLMPPTACHALESLQQQDSGPGVCRTIRSRWFSNRHVIMNRSRLLSVLPISVPAAAWGSLFERLWGKVAAGNGWLGTMQCGAAAFAIHPPSRFTPVAARWRFGMSPDSLREHVHALRASAGLVEDVRGIPSNLSWPAVVDGTKLLVERIEAGCFELPCSKRHTSLWPGDDHLFFFSSIRGGSGPLATVYCEDMVPSASRVKAGLAW